MTNKEMIEKVTQLKMVQAKMAPLKKQEETLKAEIKMEMLSRKVSELLLDVFKITLTTSYKHKFDTVSFKKDNEVLYNTYYVQDTVPTYTLNVK